MFYLTRKSLQCGYGLPSAANFFYDYGRNIRFVPFNGTSPTIFIFLVLSFSRRRRQIALHCFIPSLRNVNVTGEEVPINLS